VPTELPRPIVRMLYFRGPIALGAGPKLVCKHNSCKVRSELSGRVLSSSSPLVR
jgi:hypothetical protein